MTEAELDIGTVAVLGLGVVGGSVAGALSRAAPSVRVVGWSPSVGERLQALEAGAIAEAPSAWEDAVEEADLVVLAMPLEACLRVLADLDGLTSRSATLTDVAGLKVPVRRVAVESGVAARWVGSHPMAGSEGSGFPRSRPDLFVNATVWITEAGADAKHVERVRALWRAVGGLPRDIADEEHDRSMALVSHLPQLLSNALGFELARHGVPRESLGPGGRDMSRLAGSQPQMWMDVFRHVPPELAEGLRGVAETLVRAADALETGRIEDLDALMTASRSWKDGP